MKSTKKPPTQQEQLARVVKRKGSGAVVAKELDCSQQSVSAWAMGLWLPRQHMQKKLKQLYRIPTGWVKPEPA